MPLLKANLAVTNLGGQGDSPYIYLDSLLFKYTDNGLSLVYTFEGWRENNSLGYHASHYYDSVAQTTQYLAEHYSRFYMEYDIVSGDMTGKGADSAVVLQNYPDFGVNKTQVGWVAALLDKSTPSGNTDSMPEYSSARSIVCAAGYDASDIKDGSFGVTDYNYFHNYVTLDNVRQGASLSRCTTMALNMIEKRQEMIAALPSRAARPWRCATPTTIPPTSATPESTRCSMPTRRYWPCSPPHPTSRISTAAI